MLLLVLVAAFVGVFIYCFRRSCKLVEGYKDPIYLNRYKMYQDWYPRANGTIYGRYSNVFSGYPQYPKAY